MDRHEIFLDNGIPYPLVVFRTRYGGTYEGGSWAAINRSDIPYYAIDDDVTCSGWWGNLCLREHVYIDIQGAVCVGVGSTPDEAMRACTARAVAYNRRLAFAPKGDSPHG